MQKGPSRPGWDTALGPDVRTGSVQRSAYRALNMAENRAIFIFRRFFSLGFSKCRWFRTSFRVPSRSIFFFSRRRALSTGSPFFNRISVKTLSLPLHADPGSGRHPLPASSARQGGHATDRDAGCQPAKKPAKITGQAPLSPRARTRGSPGGEGATALVPRQAVTRVPTFSPRTTRSRLPGLKRSNTMIGMRLSWQSENAVASITWSRRLSASW